MRIRQILPAEFAEKWRRLLAFQGGDPEALALAAVELLWKKYHREVEREERFEARQEAKLKEAKGRCRKIGTRKRSSKAGALVGHHVVKLSPEGVFKLPVDWYELLGCPTEMFVVPLPGEKGAALVPVEEAQLPADAKKVSVGPDRSLRLDKKTIRHANLRDRVALSGCLRYVSFAQATASSTVARTLKLPSWSEYAE